MPLTYQPFAEVPQVDELKQDLQMNVPDSERTLSALVGGGFLAAGAAREGVVRWILLGIGGALVYRGWSGHCPYYAAQDIDRRHPRGRTAGGSGVPDQRGNRAEHSVDIFCSSDVLYRFWRKLEQLPRIMPHVESVQETGATTSHWKVKAPMGQTLEWDAEIINDDEGRMIAWQSLPGASVRHAGSVWFEPDGSGATRVKVAMEFVPPAGPIGAAVAGMLGNSPQQQLEQDLAKFKEFAEQELASSAAV